MCLTTCDFVGHYGTPLIKNLQFTGVTMKASQISELQDTTRHVSLRPPLEMNSAYTSITVDAVVLCQAGKSVSPIHLVLTVVT
jgi:hypothetical protein